MILVFLVRVVLPCIVFASLHSMDQIERAQQALMLWRMNTFYTIKATLTPFPLLRSNQEDTLASAEKQVFSFSFFCESTKIFYIKRQWNYSFYKENGCEYFDYYIQNHYDCIHSKTGTITQDCVPYKNSNNSDDSDSEGFWPLASSGVEAVKQCIIELVAARMPAQKEMFLAKNIRFSDDFLYMLCVFFEEEDSVVIITPYRPLHYHCLKKLCDCCICFE